ncbi:MAG: FAD-binding protein, partial [Calditrichaeota bacterium]|nr:FAD-binding protein [Calditrichota bacterium]
ADYDQYGAFKALQFQKEIETATFNSVHSTKQTAPAQRLIDFLNNRQSDSLLKTSYVPGIESVNLNEILPKFISRRLSKGFNQFNRLMRGYITEEAQLLAVESRTSSPIRIPRFKESLMHPQIKNLYPCGEGAGYAGGIISAAMDGQRVAQAIAKNSAW